MTKVFVTLVYIYSLCFYTTTWNSQILFSFFVVVLIVVQSYNHSVKSPSSIGQTGNFWSSWCVFRSILCEAWKQFSTIFIFIFFYIYFLIRTKIEKYNPDLSVSLLLKRMISVFFPNIQKSMTSNLIKVKFFWSLELKTWKKSICLDLWYQERAWGWKT